jgi:hypothetical protein
MELDAAAWRHNEGWSFRLRQVEREADVFRARLEEGRATTNPRTEEDR